MNDASWQVPHAEEIELFDKKCDYCVVIPVINEGERIRSQLRAMKPLAEQVDILIADGGSTDGSLVPEFLRSVGVRTLLVKKDKGKLSAQLRIAYAYALRQGYKGVITVDGNNKDGVEAIPDFIRHLDKGYGLVQGSRYVKGGQAINTPVVRDLAIRLLHAPIISLAARHRYTDTTNGFRGYSREYLLDPRVQPFRDVFNLYELLAYMSVKAPRLGYPTIEIPVTRRYPDSGEVPTKISHFRGNLLLLRTLFHLFTGAYEPSRIQEGPKL
uniref:Glycosyltransferase family 2 protein n=2 Tax=Cohnella candidum TaxID=2674991 RepID=A0A3G3K5D6_9BACL|nr:glycosyltransferase family 2 protein [Cohnella candidum]